MIYWDIMNHTQIIGCTNMTTTYNLPAGQYVIADPRHVLTSALYDIIVSDILDDPIVTVNNKSMVVFGTSYGDGLYNVSSSPLPIYVDAGIIGIIPIELCELTSDEYVIVDMDEPLHVLIMMVF